MNLKKNLVVALLMTIVTTVLLGLVYPLVVTGLAQALFRDKANGQLRDRDGHTVGSEIIGQGFASPGYFHSRASAAGNGYDTTRSGGTNLGPTNKKLIDSVAAAVAAARKENPAAAACPEPCRGVPIDMVTTSASGVDPDITPDNAMFQVPRIARARGIGEGELQQFVQAHIAPRQLGFLGEPRVNVLTLNLALDERWPAARR
jgi:potassium-transporting ATPase KdpC subunit